MHLPPQAIEEFQQLFQKKYGKELSFEEAGKIATNRLKMSALARGEPNII